MPQATHDIEVADVFRQVDPKRFSQLSSDKRRVLQAIVKCRTSALGGHISRCGKCGHKEQSYNSCWNRHCPRCQGGAAFDWVSARCSELLSVPYFHLVFTLPSELRALCYQNKSTMYEILFKATSEAIQDAAERRGVKLGFFGVLHTWNQEMQYHPHLHYIVPGAGFSLNRSSAVRLGSARFLLPVRVLSKLFRGKFIDYLKTAYRHGKLKFFGNLQHLQDPRTFEHLISKSATNDWVVYAKRPFASPERVVKYLASYTHRVAISKKRLRSLTNSEVTFSARARGKKRKKRLVRLSPEQFVQRFLLHVIPKGFRRIRYYGFLYNERRTENLTRLRELLTLASQSTPKTPHPQRCPKCTNGLLTLFLLVKPHRHPKPADLPLPIALSSA
jgi:hypothetical protein